MSDVTYTYDVFISYNRQDVHQVEILASQLASQFGLRVWLDRDRLEPGRSWRSGIETAMNAAAAVLIVWGPEGLGTVQCQERDLAYALRDAHPVLRVIYLFLPGTPRPTGTWANIDTWIAFAGSLDEADPMQRLVSALKGEAPPSELAVELPDEPAPYRGLAAFGPEHARFFYGRTREVHDLIEQLRYHPFITVVGPSGSGKTSLVQAGLLSRAAARVFDPNVEHVGCVVRPGPRPLRALADALAHAQEREPALSLATQLHASLQERPEALTELVPTVYGPGTGVMLLVDRLEELFTLCDADQERRQFLDALLALLRHPHRPAWVITTLRADFYGHLARHREFAAEPVDHQLYLKSMGDDEVAEIIELPAAQVGAIFEKGLAAQVRSDARVRGEVSLPLLQHTLELLWHTRSGRWLTWDAYREIGGVEGALRYRADRVIAALSATERTAARRQLTRLIWLEEGAGVTAGRRVSKQVLLQHAADQRVGEHVLQRLADERLVVVREAGGEATVELVHDTLPLHWEQLKAWVRDDREFLLWRQRLRVNLAQWEHIGQDPGALLRGAALVEAQRWLELRADDLTGDEAKYIGAGITVSDEERRARRRQQRRITAGLAVGLVITFTLALIAGMQWRQADRQRAAAETQRQLAEEQRRLADTQRQVAEEQRRLADTQRRVAQARQLAAQARNTVPIRPDLGLLLSLEAYRLDPTWETRGSLLAALQSSPSIIAYLSGHELPVTTLAFSPDGRTLASGSRDNTIVLWDLATHRPIGKRFRGHINWIQSIAFSPDGRTLASGSDDKEVILWDVASRTQTGPPLIGHQGSVLDIAFRPDGRMLASSSADGTIVLWDVETGKPRLPPLNARANWVQGLAFRPDGAVLASAHRDGAIRLWDTTTGTLLRQPIVWQEALGPAIAFSPDGQLLASAVRLGVRTGVVLWEVSTGQFRHEPQAGHESIINSLAFSPDGSQLISGGADRRIVVWDVARGQSLGSLTGAHTRQIFHVAFSPDGRLLASAGADGSVILWRTVQPHRLATILEGHTDRVLNVAVSPDSKLVASAGADQRIMLWDAVNGQPLGDPLLGHQGRIAGLAFHPEGRILASGSEDGTVILWNMLTKKPLLPPLSAHTGEVLSLAFSPDGRLLASGGRDSRVRLWNVAQGTPVGSPMGTGEGYWVWSLAFSPDGSTLVANGPRGTLALYDVPSGQMLRKPLRGHQGNPVMSLAYSSDGTVLASGSADQSILLWDAVTGQQRGEPLVDHAGSVMRVALSPDGETLASGGLDATVILWDVNSQQRLGFPLNATGSVSSLAFTPDGQRLVSGGFDGRIILWDIQVESWQTKACAVANRNLSRAEWQTYLGPELYRKTCETLSGPDDPEMGQTFVDLGFISLQHGYYEDAERYYLRALHIFEGALGNDHVDVAATAHRLAQTYYEQRRYTEAEALFRRALVIREAALSREHPDVANTINGLAVLYYRQKRYAEAESLYRRALSIWEKSRGPASPAVAAGLNNLGALFRDQGRYSEAAPLLQRALAIAEKVLSPQHFARADALRNLGQLEQAEGRLETAEQHYRQALQVYESTGDWHPAIATVLNHLATLYITQGRFDEAEPMLERALKMQQEMLGPDHPDLATSLDTYARLLRETGRTTGADHIAERVRRIRDLHP